MCDFFRLHDRSIMVANFSAPPCQTHVYQNIQRGREKECVCVRECAHVHVCVLTPGPMSKPGAIHQRLSLRKQNSISRPKSNDGSDRRHRGLIGFPKRTVLRLTELKFSNTKGPLPSPNVQPTSQHTLHSY